MTDSDTTKKLKEEISFSLDLDIRQYVYLACLSENLTPKQYYEKLYIELPDKEREKAVKEALAKDKAFDKKCKEQERLRALRKAEERANSTDTWYHLITCALEENNEAWDDVLHSTISEEYKKVDPFRDKDVEFIEFKLWTNDHVYYSFREDDGDNWAWIYSCKSIARNP